MPLGIVMVIGSLVMLSQLTDTTSYWTIGVALFVLGIGMAMAGMPNMSIALKTLRPQDIARGSTSLTIIQQCAGAIGTATLSVILFHEITGRLAAQTPPGAAPPDQLLAAPLADAYASTFAWALALLALALIPALLRLRGTGTPAEPAARSSDADQVPTS